jgi:hypothetical protein
LSAEEVGVSRSAAAGGSPSRRLGGRHTGDGHFGVCGHGLSSAGGEAGALAEGLADGVPEGVPDGVPEGVPDELGEGVAEGLGVGVTDGLGEGVAEGSGEGETPAVGLGGGPWDESEYVGSGETSLDNRHTFLRPAKRRSRSPQPAHLLRTRRREDVTPPRMARSPSQCALSKVRRQRPSITWQCKG